MSPELGRLLGEPDFWHSVATTMRRAAIGFGAATVIGLVLGAAPSVANGVIGGVDYAPTLLHRVGRNLGASGLSLYRHVIMPASLPSIVGGRKQGWAFAWRSLMAASCSS